MEAEIRRNEILRHLCRKRYDTVPNMAIQFGVSERTIRRDINILSLFEPIYTRTGRYGGGVYITEDYNMDRLFFSNEQISLLNKIYEFISSQPEIYFSETEKGFFRKIIDDGTIQTIKTGDQGG